MFLNSQKISNGELYERTRQKRRTDIVRERRMRWYGHLMGMTGNLPAKKSDGCIHAERNRPRGGKKTSWIGSRYHRKRPEGHGHD